MTAAFLNCLNLFQGMHPTGCSVIYSYAFSRLPRGAPQLVPLPLHAGLPTDDQLAVFQPAERGTRKVVVSTNIAEVSTEVRTSRNLSD